MKTSCIRHPESTRYIQLNDWQVKFCQNNRAAAFLLSHFSAWHDWKLQNDKYYCRANDIAEAHGDGRPNNENAYLFFSMEELVTALMGVFGKKAISDGLALLESLKVISIHKNPNPRYHFDKTKYFKFYPDICNEWIASNCSTKTSRSQKRTQVIDNFDNAEMDNAFAKNALPSRKNSQPPRQNGQAITDTTINTTNNNQLTNAREDNFSHHEKPVLDLASREEIFPIVESLTAKGLSSKQFYPDALAEIDRLMQLGATVEMFCDAYDISNRSTQGGSFGVKYIAKVVEDLLAKSKKQKSLNTPSLKAAAGKRRFSNTVYENDLTKGSHWINGDE